MHTALLALVLLLVAVPATQARPIAPERNALVVGAAVATCMWEQHIMLVELRGTVHFATLVADDVPFAMLAAPFDDRGVILAGPTGVEGIPGLAERLDAARACMPAD